MAIIEDKKNIYLFYGEDNYSVAQKSRHWRKEFEKKYGDINVEIFDGKTVNLENFSNAVDSLPFLSEKKLVVIENFFRDGKETEQKKIAEKLEEVGDFCLVIFIENDKPDARIALYKKISKFGKVEEFNLLIGPKLTQWIQNEVKRNNLNINLREAQLLAETVGSNLWQMKQEIEKLSLFAAGQPITPEMIEQLITPNLSASIFKLTDYLGQKKTKESLKTLQYLLESGEDPIKIYFMMVRQFRLMIQIKDCLDQNMNKSEIIQKLKEHPYVIANTISQSKNFEVSQLEKVYPLLLKIDSDLKNGKIKISTADTTEFRMALEKLTIEICL